MAIPGTLTLEPYSYNPSWTPTAECAVDIPGEEIVLKDPPGTTLPGGGAVQITELIDAAYGEAEDEATASLIASSLWGAVDGFKEVYLNDQSIPNSDEAQQRAQGVLAKVIQIPSTLTLDTDVYGVQPGQLQPFQETEMGLNLQLEINQVGFELQKDTVLYHVQCSNQEVLDLPEMLKRVLGRAARPRRLAPIGIGE